MALKPHSEASSRHQNAIGEPWTLDPFYGTQGTFFADVDGDIAVDAIAVNDAVFTSGDHAIETLTANVFDERLTNKMDDQKMDMMNGILQN